MKDAQFVEPQELRALKANMDLQFALMDRAIADIKRTILDLEAVRQGVATDRAWLKAVAIDIEQKEVGR